MEKGIAKLFITGIVMFLGAMYTAKAVNRFDLEVKWKNSSKGYLLYSVNGELGLPRYYYMDINDYPCDTKECYRMEVRIYWDLWGHFLKIGLKDGVDLTKLNHQPFNDKDYKRLHDLLNNPEAGIQYYKLEELTPKQSEAHYYSVDAVSGATVQDVSYESVRGAVKTCYSLWKIVYGDVVAAIKQNTVICCNIVKRNVSVANQNKSEQLNDLISKILQKESVSSEFFHSFMHTSGIYPPEINHCILELVRQSSLYDKDLYKWLANCFAIVKDEEQKLAIYNFLNQNNFKTKEVKKYLVSRDFL